MSENVLDVPIQKAKGSGNCCCGACHVNPGCATGGGDLNQGFHGFCCRCTPRRICVSIDYDYGEYDAAAFIPVEAEWNCITASWNGSIGAPGFGVLDFRIGFEHPFYNGIPDKSVCYITLASDALGLAITGTFPDDFEDTRQHLLLHDCEEYRYGDLIRRSVCDSLEDVWFDIDLSALVEYADTPILAELRVRAGDYVSRPAKVTGFWDGYEDCRYNRACITYTDPYGEKQKQYACIYDNAWDVTFPDVEGVDEFDVTITLESTDPPVLSLSTAPYGVNDYDQTGTCPDMTATWDLESGASISIHGDKRADCADCRCFPRYLCVRYNISNDGSQWEGTLEWDDYYGGWSGELLDITPNEADPVTISLALSCNECTGETTLVWAWRDEEHVFTIEECPDISGFFTVPLAGYEDVDEGLQFSGKQCADCFAAPGTIACCGGEFPDTLTATFTPFDDLTDPMVRECPGATGSITLSFFPFDSGGNPALVWRGFGFPFEGCPERQVGIEVSCPNQYDGTTTVRLYNFFSDDTILDFAIEDGVIHSVVSCDPILIEFIANLGLDSADQATCCGVPNTFVQYNFKISITE